MKRLILLALMICCANGLIKAQPGLWSNVYNVSNTIWGSWLPDIALDSLDNIHLVWDEIEGSNSRRLIYYKYFNGLIWSPAQLLSDTSAVWAEDPKIALDHQGRPHVVWFDNWYDYEGAYARILYTYLQDSGWAAPLVLSEGTHYNWSPAVVVDTANNIHVFWDGTFNGHHHILHRVFDQFQWSPIEDLTPGTSETFAPKVKVNSQNHFHFIYQSALANPSNLNYMYNDGQGWSIPQPIPPIPGGYLGDYEIALDDSDHPNVVWNTGFYKIYYYYFNGISWTPPVNIINTNGYYFTPKIAVAPGKIFVTYSRNDASQPYLLYSFCQNSSWTIPDTIYPAWGGTSAAIVFDSNYHLHALITCLGDIFQIDYLDSGVLPTTITPHNPPISIPASGGNFHFDASVSNQAVLGAVVDVWFDVRLPNGNIYGPLLNRQNINMAAHSTISRTNLTQTIPGWAPAGLYYYRLHAGDFPSLSVSVDSFAFTKLGIENGVSEIGGWSLTGWDDESQTETANIHPSSFALHPCSPNPFNPSTVLSFELRVPSQVRLMVYDTAGRLVTTLVNEKQPAGTHSATFDGSKLASGIYLARLEAGVFTVVQKLVLLK